MNIPVDQVLDTVKAQELVEVLVMGWDEDGALYLASSSGRVEDIEDLMRAAKSFMMRARAA